MANFEANLAGTFHRAQTLKLGGVYWGLHLPNNDAKVDTLSSLLLYLHKKYVCMLVDVADPILIGNTKGYGV